MRLRHLLLMPALLLTMPLAMSHEENPPKPKPKQEDKGKPGKPEDAQSGRTKLAEAEAEPGQRFCMKNKEGRLHCIPFGPH